MKAHEAKKLIETIQSFVDPETRPSVSTKVNGTGRSDERTSPDSGGSPTATGPASPRGVELAHVVVDELGGKLSADVLERIYQTFKARFIDDAKLDPILLKLLTTRPELIVEIEPRLMTISETSLKGRIARLIAAGWFKEARATFAVRSELKRTGSDPGGGGNLSTALGQMKIDGYLVSDGDGWVVAPGIKVTEQTIARE